MRGQPEIWSEPNWRKSSDRRLRREHIQSDFWSKHAKQTFTNLAELTRNSFDSRSAGLSVSELKPACGD
jgi:hypothetical protein